MRISEVSEQYDIACSTLRYYERIGLIPEVRRNESGNRDYTEKDCKWVEFVKCMRQAGLEIEVLKEYIELFQQGEDTIDKRKEILIEQRNKLRAKIKDIQETVGLLNYKIEKYEQIIVEKEKELTVNEKALEKDIEKINI